MWANTERRRRTIVATLLPKGDSPVMQEERGITRRLEEEGREGRKEGGKADEKSNVVNQGFQERG